MSAESAAPALSFAGVSKAFAGQKVLDDVDLNVERGEFFGLVGMNGAGKTTCIKALLDFCDVDEGEIRILGRPSTEPAAREPIAYLPERFLPPYYLDGRDFLLFMAGLHDTEFDRDRVDAMFAALDLDHSALRKPVRQYSKGMAQKLGLAACFLSGKQVLVLDEPMSGLDPKARLLVKRYLLGLRGTGTTVFFSTHMLADVDELCDRMGILHETGLRFVGPPSECRARFGAASLEEAYLGCVG